MKETYFIQSQLLQGGIALLIIVALSYIIFPLLPIAVNYALVAVIIGAFFLHNFFVYTIYTLALMVWLKYTSVFTLELLFIAIAAGITFFTIKLFVLGKSFFISLLFLACFHILFWVFFFKGSVFGSTYMYLEFLYNGACALFLYGVHSKLKDVY